MKILKKIITVFIFISIFFYNIQTTKAAFDIGSPTATYDSNSGMLTIYDPVFTKIDYQNEFDVYASRMKLGDVTLYGTPSFHNGTLKIFINNKNAVNKQKKFRKTGTVYNGLDMSKGAIIHKYYPPNSINVVLESKSNVKSMNVKVIGLRPSMKIHSFTSDVTSLEGEGYVTLVVKGENLNVASFSVYDKHASKILDMKGDSTSVRVKLARPKNTNKVSREDVFVLHVNDVESYQQVSVTVRPQEIVNNEGSIGDKKPDVDNSLTDENNSTNKNKTPSDKNGTHSNNNGNMIVDNDTNHFSSSQNKGSVKPKQNNNGNNDGENDLKNNDIGTTTIKPELNENIKFGNITKTNEQSNSQYSLIILAGLAIVGSLFVIWKFKYRKGNVKKN